MIDVAEFDKVEMRVGTVLEVKDNKKSRNPAYVVTLDFGAEIGIKKSSAQIMITEAVNRLAERFTRLTCPRGTKGYARMIIHVGDGVTARRWAYRPSRKNPQA